MAEEEQQERLVYVCDGGDCSEKGSVELYERLKEKLEAKDPDLERVKLRKYPCFGGCDCGINITVWPDRIFYSKVTDADLDEIAGHLEGEREPVERLRGHVEQDVEEIIWQLLDSPY
ncbi:MAG: (2Fe-2S) ferredoxin domain-containing protein [Planctomycetes bacterium]|nr:(2Fe-2S) ferredoxin domain-containing protein [Planctomycetota bacterium]MCB9917859.1 (2Fe-2S) ferredoxin domain-containing protein [Planctomycetota bacterium]